MNEMNEQTRARKEKLTVTVLFYYLLPYSSPIWRVNRFQHLKVPARWSMAPFPPRVEVRSDPRGPGVGFVRSRRRDDDGF